MTKWHNQSPEKLSELKVTTICACPLNVADAYLLRKSNWWNLNKKFRPQGLDKEENQMNSWGLKEVMVQNYMPVKDSLKKTAIPKTRFRDI